MKTTQKSQQKPQKDRNQYFSTYYEQHKAKKKEQRRKNYLRQKAEREQKARETLKQTYTSHNIKVLLSFSRYVMLRAEKKKRWLDLVRTMRDLLNEGIGDISQIQQIELMAGNLVRDYYETAKKESGIKSKWNSLSEKQQQRLVQFWAREKAWENKFIAEQREQMDEKAEALEKDIEMAKFHEARGKIKCECWQCVKEREGQKEARQELAESLDEGQETNEREEVESECANCYEVKKVSVDSGLCRKCENEEESEEE